MSDAILQVQQLYERRPYPHYPLLAKPRWQDGYLGSSLFAQALLESGLVNNHSPRNFLSVGCGEILPYIIRQWEPSSTRLDCVDLSINSIRRAQFRTALLGRKINFHCDDINLLLRSGSLKDKKFDHIEAYGVLHHIPHFTQTLRLISDHLSPRGTIRIMVYNTIARDWIWQISKAFNCLKLNFQLSSDIAKARNFLVNLAKLSPRLETKLSQFGWQSLQNDTKFADTFLHPWESRADIRSWFKYIEDAGLQAFALFDRYAELDDLPNPLWELPTKKDLEERAIDLRFENNLELWLTRSDFKPKTHQDTSGSSRASQIPVRLRLTMPARNFSRFLETDSLSFGAKLSLWQGFLKQLHLVNDHSAINLIRNLDGSTASRLARLGLILPSQARMAGRYDELLKPLTKLMSPPLLPEASNDLIEPKLLEFCAKLSPETHRIEQAVKRLRKVV